MHIHGSSPNQYVAQLYAAGNDPRSLEARRAADIRCKLNRAGQQAGAMDEETSFVRQLADSVAQGSSQPYAAYSPRDRNFD